MDSVEQNQKWQVLRGRSLALTAEIRAAEQAGKVYTVGALLAEKQRLLQAMASVERDLECAV